MSRADAPPLAATPRSEHPCQPYPRAAGRGLGLTPHQLRALAFIDAYQRAGGGVSPRLADIAGHLGFRAKSTVHHILTGLEERGHIRRLAHRACAIEVLRRPDLPDPSLNGEPLQFIPVTHGRP